MAAKIIGMCCALLFVCRCAFAQAHPSAEQADAVCGPRCVLSVLEHFDREATLIDLVREMQFPKIDEGCSLDVVQRALNRRGIHTCAIRTTSTSHVRWGEPIILHSQPLNRELGHFVTLPKGDGVQPLRAVVEAATGVVLLTSSQPIENRAALASIVHGAPSSALVVLTSAGTFVLAGCHVLLFFNSKRRVTS